jgi:hypothetical protein
VDKFKSAAGDWSIVIFSNGIRTSPAAQAEVIVKNNAKARRQNFMSVSGNILLNLHCCEVFITTY